MVFDKSMSYYPLEGSNNTQALRYYATVTQPWEAQLAWNDEFDELGGDEDTSIKDKKVVLPQEIEEEEEDEIDWGANEEVLATLRLHKPQVEPASRGEPSSGIVGSTPEDGRGNHGWWAGCKSRGSLHFGIAHQENFQIYSKDERAANKEELVVPPTP